MLRCYQVSGAGSICLTPWSPHTIRIHIAEPGNNPLSDYNINLYETSTQALVTAGIESSPHLQMAVASCDSQLLVLAGLRRLSEEAAPGLGPSR